MKEVIANAVNVSNVSPVRTLLNIFTEDIANAVTPPAQDHLDRYAEEGKEDPVNAINVHVNQTGLGRHVVKNVSIQRLLVFIRRTRNYVMAKAHAFVDDALVAIKDILASFVISVQRIAPIPALTIRNVFDARFLKRVTSVHQLAKRNAIGEISPRYQL